VWAVPYDYEGACEEKPEICLGVPFFNWGPAYLETAEAVSDGKWTQSWDWNPAYWDNLTDTDRTPVGWIDGPGLTAEMKTNLDDFISGLASGDIVIWKGPINLQDGTPYLADGEIASDKQIWYLPLLLEGMEGTSE
jgi:simple sugar transport system substrate-binding protein